MQENFSLEQKPLFEYSHIPTDPITQLKKSASIFGWALFATTLTVNGIQIIASLLLGYFAPDFTEKYMEILNYLLAFIPLYFVGVPLLLLISKKLPINKPYSYEKRNFRIGEFLKIICICFPAMYLSNIPSVIITLIKAIASGFESLEQANPLESLMGDNVWIRILFVGILAPVLEEIIFRGVLLNKLRSHGEGVCIFVSAFAFGLFHGNFAQMFYAFTLGIIFAYVTVKTGKLIYSIILHVIINCFSAAFLMPIMASENDILISLAGMVVAALFILGVIFFATNVKKVYIAKTSDGIPTRRKIGAALNTSGMYAFMVAILASSVISLVAS